MSFANLYASANYFGVPDVESHDAERPIDQDQSVRHYALGPFGYPEDFGLLTAFNAVMPCACSATIASNAQTQLGREAWESINDFGLPQGHSSLGSLSIETDQKAKNVASAALKSPTSPSTRRPRKRRRQNHSCDPCRSAKRACDLPPDAPLLNSRPSSPCSMCKSRGADCTVTWRASKQSSDPKNLAPSNCPAAAVEHFEDTGPPTRFSPANSESHLLCHAIAREVRSQSLGVYFDIIEIPMSKFLSEKCVPPGFSLGMAALTPLGQNAELAATFATVQSSIRSCWEMAAFSQLPASATSRAFLTASILDVLFQRSNSQSHCVKLTSRDMLLTETYKWVAIAAGSQFAVHKSATESSGIAHERARDIAYATWCKAKHMVFTNIAANTSFRLGLSLVLFGTILLPAETDGSNGFQDASYAIHEGICRLQRLCVQARAYLWNCDIQTKTDTPLVRLSQPGGNLNLLQSLPRETRKNVAELIAAFEWLVEICQSVAIALFPRRSFTVTPSIEKFKTCSPYLAEETVQSSKAERAESQPHLRSMDDEIIAQFKSNPQPAAVLWTQSFPDHLVDSALLESGSLVIVMWKSLAHLILATRKFWLDDLDDADYADVYRHFNTMIMLVDLWRKVFGRIDYHTAIGLQLVKTDLRRSAIFCATDGDLAILIFYEISCQLQKRLANQPLSQRNSLRERLELTSHYRDSQRLTSAMQISCLAKPNLGVSSPGVQGKAGLKASIEDVRAHLVSRTCFLGRGFLKLNVTRSTLPWWYKHTN